jgi:hypothetical protein
MVNIHDAKTQLSRLVDDAAAGAEIIMLKPESRLRGSCLWPHRLRIVV